MSERTDQQATAPPAAEVNEPDASAPAGATEPEAEAPQASEPEREAVEADLDALLAETKRERDEYLELAQRARADFENYRKRAAREVEEAERRGRSRVAAGLVPVLDNLERALRATGVDLTDEGTQDAAEQPSQEVSARDALAQGVALVYRELRDTLAAAGVEAYDPRGERFDPSWHEALATRAEEGTEAGFVVETAEKGYRLDGQVLRPARVVVSE